MKIRISTIYASPLVSAQPGSVIDVSDEEGRQLIAGKCGVEVSEKDPIESETAPAIETAEAAPAPETAAVRTGRRTRNAAAD